MRCDRTRRCLQAGQPGRGPGEAAHAIVFHHGSNQFRTLWRAAPAPDRYRVAELDMRGCGRSHIRMATADGPSTAWLATFRRRPGGRAAAFPLVGIRLRCGDPPQQSARPTALRRSPRANVAHLSASIQRVQTGKSSQTKGREGWSAPPDRSRGAPVGALGWFAPSVAGDSVQKALVACWSAQDLITLGDASAAACFSIPTAARSFHYQSWQVHRLLLRQLVFSSIPATACISRAAQCAAACSFSTHRRQGGYQSAH